jgi:hypothetical protein
MNLPPQREIKIFIRDCLKHGDLVKLAEREGVHLSAISQRLNPNLDTPCSLYQALKQLRGLIEVNKEAGGKVWTLVTTIVERWFEESETASADDLLGSVTAEFADIVKARLAGLPTHQQRMEVVELQKALSRYLESLGKDNVSSLQGRSA